MSDNIAGKVVVITGASSGLGEAAARLLSAEGATVVLGARRAAHAAAEIRPYRQHLLGSGPQGRAR
jgi:NADP-dependent 3-hydroxy acid dehydrogenase YdfG